MKNIFYKLSFVCLFALAITSCEEDITIFDGEAAYHFLQDSSTSQISPDDTEPIIIEVGVTTKSDVDRQVSIFIDESSTADSEAYSLTSNVVTIPAGQYVGTLQIIPNFDFIPTNAVSLVLVIDQPQENVIAGKDTYTLNLRRECIIDQSLAGIHNYVQYDISVGDGSGGVNQSIEGSISGTTVWTELNGPTSGRYLIDDLSFGLYPQVYNDAPANDGSAGVAWVCDELNALGFDQYNDPFTYTVQNVNGSVLTLKYINGYGDRGTVEITREGGEDWPEILQTAN